MSQSTVFLCPQCISPPHPQYTRTAEPTPHTITMWIGHALKSTDAHDHILKWFRDAPNFWDRNDFQTIRQRTYRKLFYREDGVDFETFSPYLKEQFAHLIIQISKWKPRETDARHITAITQYITIGLLIALQYNITSVARNHHTLGPLTDKEVEQLVYHYLYSTLRLTQAFQDAHAAQHSDTTTPAVVARKWRKVVEIYVNAYEHARKAAAITPDQMVWTFVSKHVPGTWFTPHQENCCAPSLLDKLVLLVKALYGIAKYNLALETPDFKRLLTTAQQFLVSSVQTKEAKTKSFLKAIQETQFFPDITSDELFTVMQYRKMPSRWTDPTVNAATNEEEGGFVLYFYNILFLHTSDKPEENNKVFQIPLLEELDTYSERLFAMATVLNDERTFRRLPLDLCRTIMTYADPYATTSDDDATDTRDSCDTITTPRLLLAKWYAIQW